MHARLVASLSLAAIAALGTGCPGNDKATVTVTETKTDGSKPSGGSTAPSTPGAPKVDRASDPPADGKKKDTPPAAPQEAIAVFAVPGMRDPAGDKPYVKKLLEGAGVMKVEVDYDSKRATVTYDASQTKTDEMLGRLKAKDQFAESTLVNNRIVAR